MFIRKICRQPADGCARLSPLPGKVSGFRFLVSFWCKTRVLRLKNGSSTSFAPVNSLSLRAKRSERGSLQLAKRRNCRV